MDGRGSGGGKRRNTPPELGGDEISPPPPSSSPDTLEMLIQHDVRLAAANAAPQPAERREDMG